MSSFAIIGIGSSAGGLEALRELVSALPIDLGVSYVVVQHMSPHHKSLMCDLIDQKTQLKVEEISDTVDPMANTIYVTPPNTDVIFEDGKLRLAKPNLISHSPKPSVDRFFSSLANEIGERSVGVVLSGTGSDGAYGIQAIREAGGVTIAQDNESAKYDGMPNAAIQTGCVDLILSASDIGTHLQKILSDPKGFSELHKIHAEESPLTDLMHILLARTHVDFRDYKRSTVNRRIERRMLALGVASKEEYTEVCRNNPLAVDALFKDLLISVTRFFRDKDEFENLKHFLPMIIREAGNRTLRVWVAGCATGEEAYSIAMLISEALGGPTVELKSKVQIFATDIDRDALKVARRGVYSSAVLNDIPVKLAEKYLVKQGDGFRVIENLRSAVLFSDHNVCQDPPFQKVDLISCRNLLIYLVSSLQRKVMSRFHYALAPEGLVFLGTAETIAGSDELFLPERDATHFFRKRVLKQNQLPTLKLQNRSKLSNAERRARETAQTGPSTDRLLFEALAQSLGENSMIITDDLYITRVFGSIGKYMDLNEKSNLKMHIDLLKSPLRSEARSLIAIAFKQRVTRVGIDHLLDEKTGEGVRIEVHPIIAQPINERAALVVFKEVEAQTTSLSDMHQEADCNDETTTRVRMLESELINTRDAHQQTIEQLETSNEELQSLNEEMQSTNEELQATNEELETSNEELQSTNEELITVNEELQTITAELNGRTGELTSILESTPLAIVVTDSALQIKQASKEAMDIFQIKAPLATPHISQCILPEGYPSLAPLCSEALKLGTILSEEFMAVGNRVKLTFSPYFDQQGQISGVTFVTTMFPVLADEMEMLLDNSSVMLIKRTKDGEILQISSEAARALGYDRELLKGKNIFEILPKETSERLRTQDKELFSKRRMQGVENLRLSQNSEPIWLFSERFVYQADNASEPVVYEFATDMSGNE